MKSVYIKEGDALNEVRRAVANPDAAFSGSDVFVADVLRARKDAELLVLCRGAPRDVYAVGRVRAESYPLSPLRGLVRFASRIFTAFAIGASTARWKPNRIVCGCPGELLWMAALVAKWKNARLVFACHNAMPHRGGLVSMLNRAAIRACSGIVCHGPFLVNQIQQLGIPAAKVHEFEIDFARFAQSAEPVAMPPGLPEFVSRHPFIVMFAGRAQIDKGITDLLEAFCELPESVRRSAGLLFVGGGRDLAVLESRIRELRAESSVLSLGQVNHSQLHQILKNATVVVTPTRPEFPEGRCMVALESLVLGVPVVAPDFGPFPYAVSAGVDGLLFEAGSKAALKEALREIMQDGALLNKLRDGARETARKLKAGDRLSFGGAIEAAFS